MPESFFEKLKLCVEPSEMIPLVCESFSQRELIRFLASDGVVYPGIRMEMLPPEKLAAGWIKDAWKNPEILGGLVKALDKAHERDIARTRLMPLAEMERLPETVADICRQRKVGGLVWALLRDERAGAALVRRFLESFYRFLDKGAAASKKKERFGDHLQQGKLNKNETEKVRQILMDIMIENEDLKRDREKAVKDERKMMRQIDDLKKKTCDGQSEITALKNDLAGLRREAARKDALIRDLDCKAKTVSAGEEDLLRRRVHDLERNERKLQHEAAEFNGKLAAAGLGARAADGRLRELEKAFQQERFQKECLERDLKRLALHKEIRDQAAPPPVAQKASAPPKDKGRRLGVFVDTRYLRQASKFLQQKIDYQKLLEFVVLDRHLVKAVAYVMTAPDIDPGGFPAMLEKHGFHARCRSFVRWPDGSVHGSWGAGIAADVISLSEKLNLDIVHLVSASEDVADLLKLLKAKGLRTEVSGFKFDPAPDLNPAADDFVFLGSEIFKGFGLNLP